MIRFEGGPAAGQLLSLRRAPQFLRVVRGPRGKIDALDQLDDEPRETETLSAYRRVWDGGTIHLLARGRGGRAMSGFWPLATYQHMPHVNAETLRETDAWRAWCVQASDGQLTLSPAQGQRPERCHACGATTEPPARFCGDCIEAIGVDDATPSPSSTPSKETTAHA